MADIDFDDMNESGGRGRTMTGLVNWTGGLLSLALIAGLGTWSYKLLVRDVTGVPVVRALEGPIRIAPDEPGGELAEHQGLAVNEVAAVGIAGGPAEQVMLAPKPVELAAEDKPVPDLVADAEDGPKEPELTPFEQDELKLEQQSQETTLASTAPADIVDEPLDAAVPADETPIADAPEDALATDRAVAEALGLSSGDDPQAAALALAEAVTQGVDPLADPEVEVRVQTARRDGLGIIRSPRPAIRPDDLVVRASLAAPQSIEPVSAAPADIEVSPDEITQGTRLVQLGAFESAEVAREQWDRIGGRFSEYFAGKRRLVQRAESGGRIFYRLRAVGFEDLSDARRFCSALVAKQADCIPVVVR